MNVSINNIGLTFGKQNALNNITFELNENKIYGLLGRNGAGKTSLLSLIGSFRQPSTGTITINGEEPFENANIMQQVVFMYDKDFKDEGEHAKTFLKYAHRYRPNFDLEYAEYLVQLFKLDKNKPLKKLSKGMRSAFNVIFGLASRAPITIFDEVYLGMDAPSRDIFYKELLKDQQEHPRIIILSTHLVSEMDYLFDDVIILKNGELLLQENYDSLTNKGYTITGNSKMVDEFVQAKQLIHVEQLGDTKAVMVYGELDDHERKAMLEKGLELTPASLHEIFVHLTKEGE